MQLRLARPEDIDPLEERLGQQLAARRLGVLPQLGQVAQELDGFFRRRPCGARSPGALLLLVQSPHRGLQRIGVAVATVSGHGRLAVALDAGEGDRIGPRLVSSKPVNDGASKLGVSAHVAQSLTDEILEGLGRIAHALVAAVLGIAEGPRIGSSSAEPIRAGEVVTVAGRLADEVTAAGGAMEHREGIGPPDGRPAGMASAEPTSGELDLVPGEPVNHRRNSCGCSVSETTYVDRIGQDAACRVERQSGLFGDFGVGHPLGGGGEGGSDLV
ncbi:MAG: hypothetical protein ABSB34_02165 [Candidatus Limnocylindrales bacterium]